MKRYTNTDVAYLWADRAKQSASNSMHSLFFEGDTIYSYGYHFPIARHVENTQGERAVLFTTRRYSVTTEHHKSVVRAALQPWHYPLFMVPDVTFGNSEATDPLVQLARFLGLSQSQSMLWQGGSL